MAFDQGYRMDLVKKAGLTKVELAQRLDLNPNTIYKWKELPRSVGLYLECLIECKDLTEMKDIIERQRGRKLQKITFSKDQIALIKGVFWQKFKGAGELWFPYDCPDEERVVTEHWREFLEGVEELR